MMRALPFVALLALLPTALGADTKGAKEAVSEGTQLLDIALSIANAEESPFARDAAKAAIVSKCAEAGSCDEARRALDLIAADWVRLKALLEVARCYAERGQVQEASDALGLAHELSLRIDSESSRASTWQQLGEACVSLGQNEAARAILQQLLADAQALSSTRPKDDTLAGLSRFAEQAGFSDLAREASMAISDPAMKAEALAELAVMQAGALQPGEIEALLDEALNQARTCRQPSDQALALAHAARTCAELGFREPARTALDEAARAAESATDSRKADEAWEAIVEACLAADLLEQALSSTWNIEQQSRQADVIQKVVARYAAAGRYDTAIEIADGLEQPHTRSLALLPVVESYAREGEYERAAEVINGLQGSLMRDKALQATMLICAERGEFALASELSLRISGSRTRAAAQADAAQAFLATGDAEMLAQGAREVERIASEMAEPELALNVAIAAARAYAAAGARDDALRMASRSADAAAKVGGASAKAHAFARVGRVFGELDDKRKADKAFEDAVKATDKTSCWGCKQSVLKDLGEEMIAAGRLDLASDIARTLGSDTEGAALAMSLVELYVENGQHGEAREMIVNALQRLARADSVVSHAQVLASLALVCHRHGFELGAAERQALAELVAAMDVEVGAVSPDEAARLKRARLVYFYTAGCSLCAKVKVLLDELETEFQETEVRRMDLMSEESMSLNERLCVRAGLPEDSHGLAPSVFSANRGLVGDTITRSSLRALIASAHGLPAPWELAGETGTARARYGELTTLMVISGGLVDGLNPCAFAAIIFFITYLTYIRKGRKEIALAGLLFIGAVFVTYLAIGVALYWILDRFGTLSVVMNRILYSVMAVLLAAAAALSIGDGVRCLQGRPQDMKLKLPERLGKKVRLLITRRARLGLTVLTTLALGCLIALLEFPCTGQVYTPIVLMVQRFRPESLGAFLWLVLYNTCFILPLVVLFLCVYFGIASERLGQLFQRHIAKAKFAMAAVFLGLFVVLVLTMP